ncbi:hypothetical protein, partial [Streptomyces phytophilus]|uniref:hypothetical protein n=1 Tax=Streptomyces phytophilus TaxID=722715 RepID=UPI001C688AFF
MPDDITPRPPATMRPAVAVELPPVAFRAIGPVRKKLLDHRDASFDLVAAVVTILADEQRLTDPEEAAGIARASYAGALAGAADDVERLLSEHECGFTDARSCHQALTQLYGRWRTEAGKDTPTGGESTRTADDAVARCRLCGCTEAAACEGGCVWVANDLMVDVCSACVPAGPDVVRMTWEQRVTLHPGVADGTPAEVPMRTPAGVPAIVGLTDTERRRLGSMLTLQGPATAPCPTPRCGISADELRESIPELGVARYGWISVQVAG